MNSAHMLRDRIDLGTRTQQPRADCCLRQLGALDMDDATCISLNRGAIQGFSISHEIT